MSSTIPQPAETTLPEAGLRHRASGHALSEEWLNLGAVFGLSAVLLAAFILQFAWNEFPCPLCLLQRVAFSLVLFGFLLNLRFGSRPSHYGLVLLAACFGMAVSGRQTLLHIVPGTGAYGSALLGLHFYTWAFVLFAATVPATGVLLLLHPRAVTHRRSPPRSWAHAAAALAIGLTLLNAASTFAQCGPIECADDPVSWWVRDQAPALP